MPDSFNIHHAGYYFYSFIIHLTLLIFVGADYLFPEWNIYEEGGENSFYNFAFSPAIQADFMGFSQPVINISQTSGLPNVANSDFGHIQFTIIILFFYFTLFCFDEQ